MFTVSEVLRIPEKCLRFPKYVYGLRYDISRCRESPGGPPSVAGGSPAPGASCHAPVTAQGVFGWGVLAPTSFFLSVTSVVPVPDGTATREFPLFP